MTRYSHLSKILVQEGQVVKRGDLVLVPGAVHAGRVIGGEELLTKMEYLGKVIDRYLSDVESVIRFELCVHDVLLVSLKHSFRSLRAYMIACFHEK